SQIATSSFNSQKRNSTTYYSKLEDQVGVDVEHLQRTGNAKATNERMSNKYERRLSSLSFRSDARESVIMPFYNPEVYVIKAASSLCFAQG
ncbi:MAG: hypothetical protein KAT15_01800, partial [Bacteroidales bacterium]|nr:hypothetical protein [Bacteroidales bacterium]